MKAGSEVTEWRTGNKLQGIKAEEQPGKFIDVVELMKGIRRSCMGIQRESGFSEKKPQIRKEGIIACFGLFLIADCFNELQT